MSDDEESNFFFDVNPSLDKRMIKTKNSNKEVEGLSSLPNYTNFDENGFSYFHKRLAQNKRDSDENFSKKGHTVYHNRAYFQHRS